MKNANVALGVEFHMLMDTNTDQVTWRIHLSVSTIPTTNEKFLDCCPNGHLEKNYDFSRLSSAISCGIDICERFDFPIPDGLRYPTRCILNNPVALGVVNWFDTPIAGQKSLDSFFQTTEKTN